MATPRITKSGADKLPLQSKKFVAYIIADLGWKAAICLLLYQLHAKFDYYSTSLLLTLIIVSGFIQVGYILGEVALDRYTRMAEKNLTVLDKDEIKKLAREMGGKLSDTDDQ
jgi:uncharacterized protein YneF (UPF0154 family)